MKTKQIICLFILLISYSSVNAGGDYWATKLKNTIKNENTKIIEFLLLENGRGPVSNCNEFTVLLDYKRVPSYSWLPFISTSHPTEEETAEAVKYLNLKYSKKEEVNFGYIGGGLMSLTKGKCSFQSKGLKLKKTSDTEEVVFSFFDEI